MSDLPKGPFDLSGMRFAVFGVANEDSLCWAIAALLVACGAEVIFFCHPRMFGRVKELATRVGMEHVYACDVTDDTHMNRCSEELARHAPYNGCVHGIAFAPKDALQGSFLETPRESFRVTLDTSCFSLLDIANRIAPHMVSGGSIITLTFDAAVGPYPNYKIMGVAKATLNSLVEHLALYLGPQNIRVNAISASPEKTLASRGVEDSLSVGFWAEAMSPLGRRATLLEIAHEAAYLLSPLSSGKTGQICYVDAGSSVPNMVPRGNTLDMMKAMIRIDNIMKGRPADENVDLVEHLRLGGRVTVHPAKQRADSAADVEPITGEDIAAAMALGLTGNG